MIAGGTGLRGSAGLLGLALACFALGFAVAFVLQWAFDSEARLLLEAKAANAALEQRVQELDDELRSSPIRRSRSRTSSTSLGEPVRVQIMRVGPDGLPKADH